MTRLLGMMARRDRVQVPVWILVGGLLAYASAAAVGSEFGTTADRAQLLRLAVATPSLVALRGVPDGASLGSYVFFQIFTYLALLAGFMSMFLATRHTRADEERGRRELLESTAARRTDVLVSMLVWGTTANVVLGAVIALALIVGGLPQQGAWLAGAAVAAVGWCFLGLAAAIAEASPTGRAANAVGAAVVGVAFLLRAVGDATGTPSSDGLSLTSAWPSWLSPIGWGQQTFAFTRSDPRPLLIALGVGVLAAGVAVALRRSRDLGSSLLRERPGPARAGSRFRSNRALVWRLQRTTMVGWAIGGVALGLLAGSLADRLRTGAADDGRLTDVIGSLVPGGRGGIADLFVAAIMTIAGVLAAAAAVQTIARSRSEEADGRTELVLQGAVRRTVWFADTVVVALISATVVLLAAGLAGGVAFLGAGEGAERFWSTVGAALVHLPAAAVLAAVTAVVWVAVPRATIAFGWGVLGMMYLLGQFGGLLRLPQWLRDVSPFAHTPALPGPDPDWSGLVVMIVLAIVVLAAGVVLVRCRELTV